MIADAEINLALPHSAFFGYECGLSLILYCLLYGYK